MLGIYLWHLPFLAAWHAFGCASKRFSLQLFASRLEKKNSFQESAELANAEFMDLPYKYDSRKKNKRTFLFFFCLCALAAVKTVNIRPRGHETNA